MCFFCPASLSFISAVLFVGGLDEMSFFGLCTKRERKERERGIHLSKRGVEEETGDPKPERRKTKILFQRC